MQGQLARKTTTPRGTFAQHIHKLESEEDAVDPWPSGGTAQKASRLRRRQKAGCHRTAPDSAIAEIRGRHEGVSKGRKDNRSPGLQPCYLGLFTIMRRLELHNCRFAMPRGQRLTVNRKDIQIYCIRKHVSKLRPTAQISPQILILR